MLDIENTEYRCNVVNVSHLNNIFYIFVLITYNWRLIFDNHYKTKGLLNMASFSVYSTRISALSTSPSLQPRDITEEVAL